MVNVDIDSCFRKHAIDQSINAFSFIELFNPTQPSQKSDTQEKRQVQISEQCGNDIILKRTRTQNITTAQINAIKARQQPKMMLLGASKGRHTIHRKQPLSTHTHTHTPSLPWVSRWPCVRDKPSRCRPTTGQSMFGSSGTRTLF